MCGVLGTLAVGTCNGTSSGSGGGLGGLRRRK